MFISTIAQAYKAQLHRMGGPIGSQNIRPGPQWGCVLQPGPAKAQALTSPLITWPESDFTVGAN